MRILLLGDSRSGKTTYINKMCNDIDITSYRKTEQIETSFYKYKQKIVEFIDIPFNININDIRQIGNYDGVMVFYSGKQISSLINAQKDYVNLKISDYYNNQPVLFIANKLDNKSDKPFFTQLFNIPTIYMSIKTNYKIKKPIDLLHKLYIKNKIDKLQEYNL